MITVSIYHADIAAGYIDKENEVFGIPNDELFQIGPPSWWYPIIVSAETTLKRKWIQPDPAVHEIFTNTLQL